MKSSLKIVIRLLLTIGGVATIANLVYWLLVFAFGFSSDRPIYWLALYANNENSLASIYLVIFLGLGVIYIITALIGILFLPKNEDRKVLEKGARGIILVFGVNWFIIVVASFMFPFFDGGGPLATIYQHIQTSHLTNRVYHLLYYDYDPAEGYNAQYIIYECSHSDIFCAEIYSISRSNGGITPDVKDINLVPDLDTNTVFIIVNGEIAYTHLLR